MKTRIKRGLAWALAAVFSLAAVPMAGWAAQYDLSKNTYIDVRTTPTGRTGQNISINMVFSNNTGDDLKGVSVMFDQDAAENEYNQAEDGGDSANRATGNLFPFEITSSTFNAKIIGTVNKGSSKTFSLSARVRRDIPEGYYTVPLEVKIQGTHADYERVNVWITKSTSTTDASKDQGTIRFEMGENEATPYGVYPNVMNFSISLRNASNITAQDVNVQMGLSEDSTKFPFDINDSNYTRHFDRIGGGETVQVPYSMSIRSDTYSGYYPIKFTIEYKDSSEGDVQKAEKEFYVRVKNKDKEENLGDWNENKATKARIVVESFKTNPEKIFAGQDFELELVMKNASTSIPASNIMFTLKSEEATDKSPVFSTDTGSSSIVVNELGAGKSTQLKIKLRSKAGVEQRSYGLTISETYDSPEFKNAKEDVAISIPLHQEARMNTGTIEVMPGTIAVGSETNVMFPINNTGKVQLYNVMATFEAPSIKKTDTYVGNIKPGETGNVDVMVTGAAPTTDDGKVKITITYEDENGNTAPPVEKELTLMVTEPQTDTGMEDGMEGEGAAQPATAPTGMAKYKKFIWPAVAVVVVGGIVIIAALSKRKKKKAAQKEEEDIDDEIS